VTINFRSQTHQPNPLVISTATIYFFHNFPWKHFASREIKNNFSVNWNINPFYLIFEPMLYVLLLLMTCCQLMIKIDKVCERILKWCWMKKTFFYCVRGTKGISLIRAHAPMEFYDASWIVKGNLWVTRPVTGEFF
jgi:hypothetical protein